jgi:hypothetical protein
MLRFRGQQAIFTAVPRPALRYCKRMAPRRVNNSQAGEHASGTGTDRPLEFWLDRLQEQAQDLQHQFEKERQDLQHQFEKERQENSKDFLDSFKKQSQESSKEIQGLVG